MEYRVYGDPTNNIPKAIFYLLKGDYIIVDSYCVIIGDYIGVDYKDHCRGHYRGLSKLGYIGPRNPKPYRVVE